MLSLSRVLSFGALAAAAHAQPIVDVEVVDGQVLMTAVDDGTVLVDPRGISMHDGGPLEVVTPVIDVVPVDDGYDVVYTFTNNTNEALPLGRLKLGVIPIGEQITYREFRWHGRELEADAHFWNGMSIRYPLSLYSPVHVIHGDEWTIGISLQYPVLEYEHDVTFSMVSPGGAKAIGPGGKGWALIIKTNNHGNENDDIKMVYSSRLEPGETQTYTLSVRATKNKGDWMRTLLPYREFFHEHYGGVRYERDPRPVYGFKIADGIFIAEDNPEGWTSPNTLRPDYFTWQPRIDWMFERDNWPRMMAWMPGGVYEYEREEPFDFVLNWEGDENLMLATHPELGFAQVEQAGRTFGLWWSQSINYSESYGNLIGFDLYDPDQVQAALAEIDLAVATGATMIGLDTFTHKKCAMWDLYKWLQIIQLRHPHVTYVVEPLTMDFLHTIAPSHFTGHDDRHGLPEDIEDIWMFHGPHLMADFLNPGHEIWGHYRYWAYQFYDVEVTPELVFADMQEIADYGMCPTIMTGMELDLDQPYEAKETWHDTVPADLLYFAPPKDPFQPTGDEVGIYCVADMDKDGKLTVFDLVAFSNAFAAGEPIADVNADGLLNIVDFVDFLDLFEAGCA